MNFYKLLSKHKKIIVSLFVIFVLIIFSNRQLLRDVVYESDDYKLHAVRVANYYLALKQGQFPVRWGPNLNGGYGYPSFNYMYHTPYFIGAVLHSTGFSVQESLNLTVLLSLLLASVSCYFFVRSYSTSEPWNMLLALFFVLNPYILLNVYWRGAIGELFFYATTPLFFLGIKHLLEGRKKDFYFLLTATSVMILTLSHLPSLIPLLLLFIFFIVTNKEKLSIKKAIFIVFACVLGFLLSAWYWIPAYFEQWMVIYENAGSLAKYQTQFVNSINLFTISKSGNSSEFFKDVLQIGSISVVAFVFGIALLRKTKKNTTWLLLIIICLVLISEASLPLWNKFTPLQYVQFPWRFLWIIIFSTVMILIHIVTEKKVSHFIKKIIATSIFLGLIISTRSYVINKGETNRLDFDWYHPTFETGSSFNEHLPVWAKTSYYFPDELLYVTATQAATLQKNNLVTSIHKLSELQPTILKFDGKTISYSIHPDQEIIVLFKRLFYPGWEASLEKEKQKIIINIPEYEGIIAVTVPNQKSTVTIDFTGFTPLRKCAEIISVFSFLFLVGQIIFKQYKMRI